MTDPVAHRLRQINTAFWKYSTNPPRLAPLERREDWVFEPLYSASAVEALKAENDALLSLVERQDAARELIADWVVEGTEDLPDDTPVIIKIGTRSLICDELKNLRAALQEKSHD